MTIASDETANPLTFEGALGTIMKIISIKSHLTNCRY